MCHTEPAMTLYECGHNTSQCALASVCTLCAGRCRWRPCYFPGNVTYAIVRSRSIASCTEYAHIIHSKLLRQHMSRFRNLSYIKVATPKMLTFELGNMWWSSAQRWKALAEAILVRHFIFWTEKKIDSKNGLKVERKSRKMLVWHDALCFFSTFQLLHPRTCVSNESTKGFDPNQLGTWWTRPGSR